MSKTIPASGIVSVSASVKLSSVYTPEGLAGLTQITALFGVNRLVFIQEFS